MKKISLLFIITFLSINISHASTFSISSAAAENYNSNSQNSIEESQTGQTEISIDALEPYFDELGLDAKEIDDYINGLSDDFNNNYRYLNQYYATLNFDIERYNEIKKTVFGNLLTCVITSDTLDEDEISHTEYFSQTMVDMLTGAIQASFDELADYLTMLYGGEGTAEYDETYREMILIDGAVYESIVADAETSGENFKATLSEVLSDGAITDDEYTLVTNEEKNCSEILNRLQNAEQIEDFSEQSETLSSEEYLNVLGGKPMEDGNNAKLSHVRERAKQATWYDIAIENGELNPITDESLSTIDRDNALASLDEKYHQLLSEYATNYERIVDLITNALTDWSDSTGETELQQEYEEAITKINDAITKQRNQD